MPLDRVTRWFLAAVVLAGIVYVCFDWTPSSYGVFLNSLQAPNSTFTIGSSRTVRSDEWAVSTPYFQASVRNGFRRVNGTSFYREDLRNFYALPLADWSLLVKPQLWAFFLAPPATAFSIYFAMQMCAFLIGYQLFLRHLGIEPWLAVAVAVMLYCTGFVQFWWTTYGPLLAGLPWILLIVFAPMRWWKKALACCWAFPALVLSHTYPALLATFVWSILILALAIRPSLLRSRGDLLAIAAGVAVTIAVVFIYYADTISVMRGTVYPGHRVAIAGTTSIFTVLSQLSPFLAFRLGDYQNLAGPNICEIGTVGTFLPLVTLCLARYRSVFGNATLRRQLTILLIAIAAMTLWEIAPIPTWIGQTLLWNLSGAQRWLFASGFLLTIACLLIWRSGLVSLNPLRICLFVLLGPIASLALKSSGWIHDDPAQPLTSSLSTGDFVICGLAILSALVAWYLPATARAPAVIAAIALMNVYGFAQFNPLQPADPIFNIPDSPVVDELRKRALADPDGTLAVEGYSGSTLNGLGFRAVSHALMAPRLDIFHRYFPTMDRERFNWLFNRYAHIILTRDPLPKVTHEDSVNVPIDVFLPIRNVRTVMFVGAQRDICTRPAAGGIDKVESQNDQLTVEGWAPWRSETDAQGIRVLSARPLRSVSLSTITRPDIAEQLQDYGFVKSGFKLQVASNDGNPLRAADVVLLAIGASQTRTSQPGTSHASARLPGFGCP